MPDGSTFFVIFFWISLFLSFRVTGEELTKRFATGGFPIRSFVYSSPPMGNDHVPLEAWGGFAVNVLFWFFVWSLIFPLLPERFRTEKWKCIIVCGAIVLTIIGKGYLLLGFD